MKTLSFRFESTDQDCLAGALLEEGQRRGLPLPTQTAGVRAALYHFWRIATPEQRENAFTVVRSVGPVRDLHDKSDGFAEREAAERALEDGDAE